MDKHLTVVRHLYSLLVSLDANFRLKNRLRSSDEADPGLVTGLAYFVEPTAYSTHLKKYSEQKDVRGNTSPVAQLD